MKKIFSFITLAALLCAGTASACVKPKASVNHPCPFISIIVMDSTQALLDKALVKAGSEEFVTSYDGRVQLAPEKAGNSLTVSCEGFETRKITHWQSRATKDGVLPVILKRKDVKPKKDKREELYYSKRGLGTEPRLLMVEETAMAAPEAPAAPAAPATLMPGSASGAANVSAGRLTAGEVNDFAKWYFWPRVLDGTHSAYIQEWGLEPRRRHTVQVMNKDGYPVANRSVNLTDKAGNTVFQAVTDNTGKAELWNGLCGAPAEVAQPAWETVITDEPCETSQDVDVVFIFDATGSMGDELRYLQAEMKDVIARAQGATGGLNIRTGAVVYRDHGDDYITRISRLTEDIRTTQAFIDKQEADGGGDYPEAVPEALMAAMNSSGWNEEARARIAFLVLDAPCHKDSATLALLHEQVLNAAALGVRVVPVVCSGLKESGEYLMRSIALATNGTSFFLTDDSGIGRSHLRPATDSLKVERLNDMLVRTIVEFSLMPACEQENDPLNEQLAEQQMENIPNPFEIKDLEDDDLPVPFGEGISYLVDVSGKLIMVVEGAPDEAEMMNRLPVGVYFIKTFSDGRWHTRKILNRQR